MKSRYIIVNEYDEEVTVHHFVRLKQEIHIGPSVETFNDEVLMDESGIEPVQAITEPTAELLRDECDFEPTDHGIDVYDIEQYEIL